MSILERVRAHEERRTPLQFVDPNLPRDIFGWRSPRLDLEMPIVRYGRWGHPLLLFPTAQADFLENERFFLIKAIEPLIFAGKVQVFSIDSINKHAWMNKKVSIPEAARRNALYSGYVEEEVVPHIRTMLRSPHARIATSGASFGAFHAANAFFRRPDLFDSLVAMSGFYDLGPDYLNGYSDDNCFFNNPMWYMRELHDGARIAYFREHTQIHFVTGQGSYEAPWASERMSSMLWSKGIPNNLDKWGFDIGHDWPSWRLMLPHYLGQRLGW